MMRRELTARHEASVRGLLTLLTAKAAAMQQQVAAQTVLASLPLASVRHKHALCLVTYMPYSGHSAVESMRLGPD